MENYRKSLTVWYNREKRALPWRETSDPYKIWVSEVILQQTRVAQGMAYFFSFLDQFPDVERLANAREADVLKVWQGLGYYSRARNMHQAAQTIVQQHNGIFPSDYQSIRNLKGIGDYTAAAIASIAFQLPYAVVDGNVYRVLSRLFGISTPIDSTAGKKEFNELAQTMLDRNQPGEFNQAIMEFGALQCLPVQPQCMECPFTGRCIAYLEKLVAEYPVKSKQVRQRERHFNYLYLYQGEKIILEQRGDDDIWRNMYQFPLIETSQPSSTEEIISSPEWNSLFKGLSYSIEGVTPEKLHLLTHQKLHIRYFTIRLHDGVWPGQMISTDLSSLSKYPVPKPVEHFLQEMGH